jgi:SAM-dependent methyltransferase/GNAT superfamily N-acetyltransferase
MVRGTAAQYDGRAARKFPRPTPGDRHVAGWTPSRYRGDGSHMLHRLRPAESSDFDWLLALQEGREDVGASAAERRTSFTHAFATQPWWVVEVEREPVGALSVRWDEEPAVLHAVALLPQWQGRGLGTRIVHDVLLQARERQQGVVVELREGDPALGLFRRLGFWPDQGEGEGGGAGEPAWVRLCWQASVRTDATLRAAMSPWEDPQRRRAWARRLFEPSPADAVGFCRFAAGRNSVPDAASMLIVGCGPGRLLRPLAALGFCITATEPDPDYCAAAMRMGAVIGEAATVRAGELLELEDEGAYDLAIAFDGVLWSLPTHAARVDAAVRLRRALRPGGVLMVEGPNFPWILKAYREPPATTEIYHRATVSRIPAHAIDFHNGVLEHRDTFVVEVDGEEAAEWTDTRCFALLDLPFLRLALEQAGLTHVETFRDLRATGPSRITGPRIVLTARAP